MADGQLASRSVADCTAKERGMASKELAESSARKAGNGGSGAQAPELETATSGRSHRPRAKGSGTSSLTLRAANRELASINAALHRKASELRATIGDLESVQDSMGAPLVLVDRNLIVRRFNQAMGALFALGPESLGKPLRPETWSAGLADLHERIRTVVASGEAYEREIMKGRRHFRLRASPYFPSKHTIAGAVLLFDDITELVEARRALKRGKEDLRAALLQARSGSAAKSLFLSNMSHEFRTPLNAIMGFSEIIAKEIMGPVGQPKYREYAADILASAQHLRAIISRILDLSKVEAGKVDLDESVCDAAGLVHDATKMLAGACDAKGITLDLRVPRRPLRLLCDPAMVRQIVINLVQNAICFSRTGQVVRIEVACTRERMVRLTVADRGIGMTRDEIAIALRPFEQVRAHPGVDGSGLGLGLPLVKCIAELHGAIFDVGSRKGRGTVVTVRFPPERCVRAGTCRDVEAPARTAAARTQPSRAWTH